VQKDLTPIFDPKSHTYTDPVEKFSYTSVTKWVEKFKAPFDELSAATRIATRECVSVETILKEWEKKREDSKKFGTKVHKLLEVYNSTGKVIDTALISIINSFMRLNLNLNKKNTHFEKLVFNKKLKIAGMSDVIMHNEDGKTFNVYDFKTNKKLRHKSPFNENLLPPLQQYPCCEYFTYALQLSMYAYLYKLMTRLEPLDLKLFWLSRKNPENYEEFTGDWKEVVVPYMEKEILDCLSYEQKKNVA